MLHGKIKYTLLSLLLLAVLSACQKNVPSPDAWDLSEEQLDSLHFAQRHHYSEGANFIVIVDSLELLPSPPDEMFLNQGSCWINDDDRLVVAEIRAVKADTTDSIWVKVARDQMTMGWVPENRLLHSIVPDDPISQFIHLFSSKVLLFFIVLLVLAIIFQLVRSIRKKRIRMIHFNDINSIYPTLLCMDIAGAAVLYSTIQLFYPEIWQEFYYHPTLNPFGQGFVLGAFLVLVWSFFILLLATLDDVRHKLDIDNSLPYIISLGGFILVLYLFFTLTTLIYIGYVFLPLYWLFALLHFRRHSIWHYNCGRCGKPLRHKGICPHCGALNT